VVVITRRVVTEPTVWKRVPEEGNSDLLVLLSPNRWVRIQGSGKDLVLITAPGRSWLREETFMEGVFVGIAKMLVFAAASLFYNVTDIGMLWLVALFVFSVSSLGMCNVMIKSLWMFGLVVRIKGKTKQYQDRSDMFKDLIAGLPEERRDVKKETEWAIEMGLTTLKND
jgi:hypothetical protein